MSDILRHYSQAEIQAMPVWKRLRIRARFRLEAQRDESAAAERTGTNGSGPRVGLGAGTMAEKPGGSSRLNVGGKVPKGKRGRS